MKLISTYNKKIVDDEALNDPKEQLVGYGESESLQKGLMILIH